MLTRPRLLSLISLISATTLVACSGGDDPDGGTRPDSGPVAADAGFPDSGSPDAGTPDSGTPDAGAMSCLVTEDVDTTEDPTCTADWTATVRGTLETDDGQPIDDGRAQVCIRSEDDTLTCLRPEESCPNGEWEVFVPEFVRCIKNMVMRTFVVEAQLAETFCDFDLEGLGVRATLPEAIRLYRTVPAPNLPPFEPADGERAVTLESGLEVQVTPSQLFEGYERLGSVHLTGDVSPAPCFVSPEDDFDAIWGFTPTVNIDGATGFPFTITDTGLAPGTEVDLYVLGGLDCRLDATPESNVEEAHWANYATVTTGANGEISGNLPCFNWFAYKAR